MPAPKRESLDETKVERQSEIGKTLSALTADRLEKREKSFELSGQDFEKLYDIQWAQEDLTFVLDAMGRNFINADAFPGQGVGLTRALEMIGRQFSEILDGVREGSKGGGQ